MCFQTASSNGAMKACTDCCYIFHMSDRFLIQMDLGHSVTCYHFHVFLVYTQTETRWKYCHIFIFGSGDMLFYFHPISFQERNPPRGSALKG